MSNKLNWATSWRWARQSNLSGGVSLRRADGWNLKNHSHLTVARHLREKTHPSILVVTIREGEERGRCRASLRELLRFVKDQIEERGVAIIVSNKESVKTLLREKQLKHTDVEEMRVITNDRHIAEQIKSDLTFVRTGKPVAQQGRERHHEWIISWRIWKNWQRAKFEEHRDEWN